MPLPGTALKAKSPAWTLDFDMECENIIYDRRLRECNYGNLNGGLSKKVKYEEHINKPFENGESLVDVEKRIMMLIDDIKNKFTFKKIALISHRAPQLALDVCLNEMIWSEAIDADWRTKGEWQPGWKYYIDNV